MKLRLNRSLQLYYILVLVIAIAGMGWVAQSFWLNGFFSSNNMTALFEASLQLEEMKKEERVREVEKLVDNDRVRDAVALIGIFEKESQGIQSVRPVKSFEIFDKTLTKTKRALNRLFNFSELRSIMLVLSNKVTKFESFVSRKNWRTLTRMSKRIKAKVHPSRVRASSFLNLRKLTSLHRLIEKDIKMMEEVTMNSVLNRQNKQQIMIQIESLNIEMGMMREYLIGLNIFYSSSKELNSVYSTWFNEIVPIIALKKIEIEKNNKNLILSFLGLFSFLILSLIMGYFVYKGNNSRIRREIEFMATKAIKEGLIPFNDQFHEEVSADFKKELTKYREYFHKRMSFGTVFQEAIPFSSALLDSNLNLIWGNNLFYEHFYLEDKGLDGSLSWDFLQQFTNLGEDDPVLIALNQGVAGIYQIQIRRHEGEEGLPYEMYVSPVEYAEQSRIMIFFYPLRNLEETIKNQTKSIVGPVSRTLDSLMNGAFKGEVQERLERDFTIAGIGEVFNKFKKYNDFIVQQKYGFLEEIESLENSLYEQYKLMSNVRELQSGVENNLLKIIEYFDQTKRAVTHNIDLRYELESQFERSLGMVKSVIREEDTLLERSLKAGEIIEENIKAFESVSSIRDRFKVLKSKIDDFRYRLSQSIDQVLLFVRREPSQNDKRLEEGLGRIRLEMKGVEQIFSSFSDVVRSLDVGLSKVGLIVEQSEVPDFDDFQNKMKLAKKELEDFTFRLGHIVRSGEKSDEIVVHSLKSLYRGFQDSRYLGGELSSLIEVDSVNKTDREFSESKIADSEVNFNTDVEVRSFSDL